jgi:hypothetical protein
VTLTRALRAATVVALMASPMLVVPASSAPRVAPAVVAILGEPDPLNVLHSDFRTRDGRDAVLPAGMPKPVRVVLPRSGDFDARVEAVAAGPLGHLKPRTLYYVAGTRLLVYSAPNAAGSIQTDAVSGDRLHATGVVDAAIGRRHGTAPDALAVFVLGGGAAPWDWVASQAWIDIASTSDYGPPQLALSGDSDTKVRLCEGAAAVRSMVAAGRVVMSSSGNTTDPPEALMSPNGLPEVFQVGGVDATGRTYLPPHPAESDPWYAAGTVVRPYEVGELYSFMAAGPDSFDGTAHFGGTSGATPRVAGWAARLVEEARRITGGGPVRGALAAGRRVSRGPLADGRLTGGELTDLLRHVAMPAEPASPGRYFVEGYGAVNARAVAAARAVLRGSKVAPARPDEDTAAASTRQARAALFNDARCAL